MSDEVPTTGGPAVFPGWVAGWWTGRYGAWTTAVLAALVVALAAGVVDLTPRVEGDFFFADDDPQLEASREIARAFPSGDQIVLRVEGAGPDDPGYRDALDRLATAVGAVDGIATVYAATTHDIRAPLYGRILRTPDPGATNVIAVTDGTPGDVLVPRVEAAVAAAADGSVDVVLSGVPVIVELIRRSLLRDLVVFSTAALGVFALLVGLVYRDPAVVVGTMLTCLLAVAGTLLVVQAAGVGIGLLTANLVTIVFVLTLSHIVFLTGNWRRAVAEVQGGDLRARAVRRGVADTLEASFWSMATTLLGFLSLLVATAEPLRELGVAGAVGAVVAMAAAYLAYPAFLGRWARTGVAPRGVRVPRRKVWAPGGVLTVAGLVVVAVGAGVPRLDTDPGLLRYFDPDGPIHSGLERIDRDGGSSTLRVVVRDADSGALDTPAAYRKLRAYQEALEADSVVGVVLSPAVLIEQARTVPLARLLPIGVLLDMASSDRFDRVALGFVTEDRAEGLYSLRLRESMAGTPRAQVVERLTAPAPAAGLEVVRVGGFYDLQRQLGALIADSLRVGVGGLLALFLLVAAAVSRSAGLTARMWVCLAGIPAVVLGVFGWAGIAVDIITAPAANVALAMGVDSMIHLVVRVRREQAAGHGDPWGEARSRIGGPILAATGIVCAGFGIFVLSSFPPTVRFGLAVILGTVTAAAMSLVVLPALAQRGGGAASPNDRGAEGTAPAPAA